MELMTAPQFSRPGAIDLSALRKSPGPSGAANASAPGGSSFVFDVTSEQSLRTEVVERSLSIVVMVSFWSPQSSASVEINAVLETLADEFNGRFLLAKIDVSTQPQLAQVLGIPQVPLVVAALRGQLAPLLQEPLPELEMRELVLQVLEAAASNGVAGTAGPVSAPADAVPDEPGPAPAKHPAAEEALLSGDLDAAIAGYEQALAASPGDEEATVGLVRAQLLKRTSGVDVAQARAAAAARPDDVQAQSLAADLDLIEGHVEDAFTRLIDLVRRSTGPEQDAARKHLIAMLSVVGDGDSRVRKARQQLASALF